MDRLQLKLDESNELLFSVLIEGTTEKPSAIRFVCEDTDCGFVFRGSAGYEPNEVKVVVPAMEGKIRQGVYEGRLEVMIEGKYVVPLKAEVEFKSGLKVVAESVKKSSPTQPPPVIAVSKPEVRVTSHAKPPAEPAFKPVSLAEKYKQRRV